MSGARIGVLVCAIFLGIGLAGPTLTIHPRAGEFIWLVEIVSPENLTPVTYSILGVIGKLFAGGDVLLGLVLALFSVVFPVMKLGLYWVAAGCGPDLARASGLLKWMHRAAKFSMAEVFVLALMVVVVKALPGSSTASVKWGAFVFVASVIGAIFLSFFLDKSSGTKI